MLLTIKGSMQYNEKIKVIWDKLAYMETQLSWKKQHYNLCNNVQILSRLGHGYPKNCYSVATGFVVLVHDDISPTIQKAGTVLDINMNQSKMTCSRFDRKCISVNIFMCSL